MMQKRKKPCNKQNQKNIKRVPLGAIPSFNYTQQIRIPTFSSTDLRSMIRSIDLRKPAAAPNPYKKTISRKSTCKSVKQNPCYQPPKMRTIMKQFKQLKLLHQNQRSKSRSPASCKSRSLEKIFPKKLSYKTLRTNPTSEANLVVKLQKTIKKLNQTDFFKDEDSLIPLKSCSDLISDRKVGDILMTQNDEVVNMSELRQFCSTGSINFKKNSNLAFKSYDSFKETMAALKIQRAWRQFRTKKLIEGYIYFYHRQADGNSEQQQSLGIFKQSFNIQQLGGSENIDDEEQEEESVELLVASQNFYQQKLQGNRVRHISNLQQQQGNGAGEDYDEIVKRMKIEQLQKWNQIISIISGSKSDNPLELQKLLQRLAEQSEINKKDLEEKTNNIISGSAKKKELSAEYQRKDNGPRNAVVVQQFPLPHLRVQSSESSQSQAMEEYDSKKYIDYLDGDIFISEERISEEQGKGVEQAIKQSKISKRKQQILLQQLQIKNFPIKLGEQSLYRSESVKGLQLTLSKQDIRVRSRQGIKKSTSEKILRKTLLNIYENSMDEMDGQINLDLLTREFLEGTDPSMQNLDMLHSEQKLRTKFAELNRMKNNHLFGIEQGFEQSQEHEEGMYQRLQEKYERGEGGYEIRNGVYERDQDDNYISKSLRRSEPIHQKFVPPIHQKSVQEEIKIEEAEESPKMKVQMVEAEIQSDSEDEPMTEQDNQKSETIATIIMSNLVLEVLKEIAKSESLSSTFKNYSLSLRPRVRKAEGGRKKKGFPTNKGEIQLFLEGLIKYLRKEEQQVFSNLEVATGPSALEMLRYMHQFGQEESEGEGQEDESNVMVIPNRVFDAYWQLKQKSIVIQIPEDYDQSNSIVFKHQFQLLKSFNKIFYRSLFDTFNECLDCERNFGQYGRPFPWKLAPLFYHVITPPQIETHIKNAQRKMMELSTNYCGLIIEKEEMVSISQEYIQQVHEDRLSRMLAADLIEAEERWIFYDDEETEILVEISGAVYTEMLIEIIQEIYEFL